MKKFLKVATMIALSTVISCPLFAESVYLEYSNRHNVVTGAIIDESSSNVLQIHNIDAGHTETYTIGRPLLQYGSSGNSVKFLQALLVEKGAYYGTDWSQVDGQFGDGTRAAVIRFQRGHRLGADGIVGPNTWSALLN